MTHSITPCPASSRSPRRARPLRGALGLALVLAACSDDAASHPPDAAPAADATPAADAVPDAAPPTALTLPGDAFYPESLSASADGTLFVGSLATGQVAAYDVGATAPRIVVGAASGVTGVAGVLVHGTELFLCSVDTTFQRATEIRSFALDGTPHGTFSLGANRFCNDMAFDAIGNLYVTDSFSGTVLRLAPAGAALEPWLSDPALAPAQAGAFGLDGVVAVDGALYLTKLDTGGIYRVAIAADGSAGAITPITVTPTLTTPDGLRAIDAHTLLVVENAGTLARLAITGETATATALATGLDQPTGVIVTRGAAWVSQGQLGRLFAQPPQPPHLPFTVVRVAL
jgi:hypothetical protein